MLTQHASRKFKYYYEWFFCNEDNLLITELFHNENNYLLIYYSIILWRQKMIMLNVEIIITT